MIKDTNSNSLIQPLCSPGKFLKYTCLKFTVLTQFPVNIETKIL